MNTPAQPEPGRELSEELADYLGLIEEAVERDLTPDRVEGGLQDLLSRFAAEGAGSVPPPSGPPAPAPDASQACDGVIMDPPVFPGLVVGPWEGADIFHEARGQAAVHEAALIRKRAVLAADIIRTQAEDDAAAIVDKARKEAAQHTDDALQEAAGIIKAARRRAEDEAADIVEAARRTARQEAAEIIEAARQRARAATAALVPASLFALGGGTDFTEGVLRAALSIPAIERTARRRIIRRLSGMTSGAARSVTPRTAVSESSPIGRLFEDGMLPTLATGSLRAATQLHTVPAPDIDLICELSAEAERGSEREALDLLQFKCSSALFARRWDLQEPTMTQSTIALISAFLAQGPTTPGGEEPHPSAPQGQERQPDPGSSAIVIARSLADCAGPGLSRLLFWWLREDPAGAAEATDLVSNPPR